MKILKDVLRKNRIAITVFAVIELLNLAVFLLYGIYMEAFAYTVFVGLAVLLALLGADYYKGRVAAQMREKIAGMIESEWEHMPHAGNAAENDYQAMITTLGRKLQEVTEAYYRSSRTSWIITQTGSIRSRHRSRL